LEPSWARGAAKMAEDGPRQPKRCPRQPKKGPKEDQDKPQESPEISLFERRALDSPPRTSSRGGEGSEPFNDLYRIRILYVMGLVRSVGVLAPNGLTRPPREAPRGLKKGPGQRARWLEG
jgi:hypothetical protein